MEAVSRFIEIKYLVFIITVFGLVPFMVALAIDKRLICMAVLGLFIPFFNFEGTALNFMPIESYRGTARGMEISLSYMVALGIIMAILLRGKFKPHLPCMGSVLFFLYFLFSVLSLTHSEDRTISFFEIWKMMMMYIVYLAVFMYLEYTKGNFGVLLYGLGAFIFICFLKVLEQHFAGKYQVKAFFPHQNSMVMFVVLINIIMFSIFLNARNNKQAWLSFFIFCCGAVSSLRTYSRGGVMSFIVSVVICFALSLMFQFRARKVPRSLLIVIFGIMGFLYFLPRIVLRFETANKLSKETRVQFATVAYNIIRDNKVFGVGINNWSRTLEYHNEYKVDRKTDQDMDLINNGIVETIYLLVAAECGIPALIALLSWFLYYFFLSIKLAYCLRNSKYFYFPAATAGGLLAIYLQSTLEWVLKQSINFMLLMIIFAMLSYLGRNYKILLREENGEAGGSGDSTIGKELPANL